MSAPQLTIRRDSQPTRCEICHQIDLFDPLTNQCQRCSSLVLPADNLITQEPVDLVRARLNTIARWLKYSYCSTGAVVAFMIAFPIIINLFLIFVKPTNDFMVFFSLPLSYIKMVAFYLFLITLGSTTLLTLIYSVYWLKAPAEAVVNGTKDRPRVNYLRSAGYGVVSGVVGGFSLGMLLYWSTVANYPMDPGVQCAAGSAPIFLAIIGAILGLFIALFIACVRDLRSNRRA